MSADPRPVRPNRPDRAGCDGQNEARPLVAVLDYGIGNLHSAHKSLVRQGADAHLTRDPGLIADAVAVVLPGVGAFGACMAALRDAGLEEPALAAVESGRPFLGICVGTQMLFDAQRGGPVGPRPRRAARHGALDPARREAAADAVEPRRRRAPRPDVRRARRAAVVLLRALAARRARRPVDASSPRASTAPRSTPRSAPATCSPPSSTPRSRRRPGSACSATSSASLTAARRSVDRRSLYPSIDLRGGHVVRLRQGDYAAETVYGDDGVAVATVVRRAGRDVDPRRRPRRGAHGRGDQPRRRRRDRRRGRRAGRGADRRRRALGRRRQGARRRRRHPRRDGLGRGARPGARRRRRRRRCPSPSGSTTAAGDIAVHGWTEASGVQLADALGRFPAAAAFVITDIERDGLLGGPDVAGLAAAVAATDVPGDRQRRRRHARRRARPGGDRRAARDHHRPGAVRGPLHRRRGRRGAAA